MLWNIRWESESNSLNDGNKWDLLFVVFKSPSLAPLSFGDGTWGRGRGKFMHLKFYHTGRSLFPVLFLMYNLPLLVSLKRPVRLKQPHYNSMANINKTWHRVIPLCCWLRRFWGGHNAMWLKMLLNWIANSHWRIVRILITANDKNMRVKIFPVQSGSWYYYCPCVEIQHVNGFQTNPARDSHPQCFPRLLGAGTSVQGVTHTRYSSLDNLTLGWLQLSFWNPRHRLWKGE